MSEPPQEPEPPEPGTPSWPAYQPDANNSKLPPTHVPYGSPTDTSSSDFSLHSAYSSSSLGSRRGRIRLIGAIVPLILLAGGGAFAIKYFNDHVDNNTTTPFNGSPNVPATEPPPDLFSRGGYLDFLDAINSETGKTLVFGATIYPAYASLDLPVDARSQHESLWFYDGDLRDNDVKGTSTSKRFDLAAVDPSTLTRLVRRAKALVDDPTAYYVIIDGPGGPFSERPLIRAYASNEFHEGAYVSADLNGKIIGHTKF